MPGSGRWSSGLGEIRGPKYGFGERCAEEVRRMPPGIRSRERSR